MNLVNKITISRILVMPFFMVSLEMKGIFWSIAAIICFFYGAFSDWLDGYLARKYDCVTDFGKFMDPLADKIFICSAFIAFVGRSELNIPAWMVTLIIAREFLVTGLRTLAVSKGVVLSAQKSGKYKTAFQLIGIFLIIFILFIRELEFFLENKLIFNNVIAKFISLTPIFLMWFLVIFTVYSGIAYLYENRKLLS